MTQAPAGWYPDPYYPQLSSLRYWDGVRWTEHAAPAAAGRATYVGDPFAVAPSPPATTRDGQPLAGWWQRALAFLLDGVILGIAQVVFSWPLYSAYVEEATRRQEAVLNDPTPPPSAVFDLFLPSASMLGELLAMVAIGLVLLAAYQVTFLRWRQATPGKLVMGLRIRPADRPGPLSWSAIFRRLGGQFWPLPLAWTPILGSLTAVYYCVDGLWPLNNPEKQALHDRFAGTVVVKTTREDQPLAG